MITATPALKCEFCEGAHSWDKCPTVFKPIKECEFSQPEDGCCSHPKNCTPECHVDVCPRLDPRVSQWINRLEKEAAK